MRQRYFSRPVLIGGLVGLVAALALRIAAPLATESESANIIYTCTLLLVTLPGLVASLIHWDAFVLISTIYGTGVGYLVARFPGRLAIVLTSVLILHFATIILTELLVLRFFPPPF